MCNIWEAEANLAFESFDFMNELTDDISLYNFIFKLPEPLLNYFKIPKYTNKICSSNMTKSELDNICRLTTFVSIFNDIQQNPDLVPSNEESFKIKCLLDKIKSVKNSSEYKQKEELRKKANKEMDEYISKWRRST